LEELEGREGRRAVVAVAVAEKVVEVVV